MEPEMMMLKGNVILLTRVIVIDVQVAVARLLVLLGPLSPPPEAAAADHRHQERRARARDRRGRRHLNQAQYCAFKHRSRKWLTTSADSRS